MVNYYSFVNDSAKYSVATYPTVYIGFTHCHVIIHVVACDQPVNMKA